MNIGSLGYVGFNVSDLNAWTRFATDTLGLMVAPSSNGARRFRVDSYAWRIALHEGTDDDIVYAGFEVSGPEALNALAERFAEKSIPISKGDQGLAAERGVTGLFSCTDPHGLQIEIYYGPSERFEQPFISPRGVSGFMTENQGLGHIVIMTADIASSRSFYCDLLGFRLSDIIQLRLTPELLVDMEFLHCNARHHTLALVPIAAPKRLNHFMLQANTLDDVGFAFDRVEHDNVPVTSTLGKHTNDHMVSFYARTPSGFEVEFGWGARSVDDSTWHVARHDSPSSWGHKRGKNAERSNTDG